jgi:hypothetical protein
MAKVMAFRRARVSAAEAGLVLSAVMAQVGLTFVAWS